jgi:very-short-patch-repair endonuclease
VGPLGALNGLKHDNIKEDQVKQPMILGERCATHLPKRGFQEEEVNQRKAWRRIKATLAELPSLNDLRLYELLHDDYQKLSKDIKSRRFQAIKTTAERDLLLSIEQFSNNSPFKSQVCIGPFIVDLFSPLIGSSKTQYSPGFQGLAVEVDGDVHFYEDKQKKDDLLEDALMSQRILVDRVPNKEIREARTLRRLLSTEDNRKRLDTRARMRVWGRIYLITFIYRNPNFSAEMIKKMVKK